MEVDYLGGLQYKGGVLQFFPTAEGYVDYTVWKSTGVFNYVYQYKDHLGNVRMDYTYVQPAPGVILEGLRIKEENHYYPFGLKHVNYNMDEYEYQESLENDGGVVFDPVIDPSSKLPNNYKYNGKELQDELGLNMYDYGARNYDPAIGRWMNIEPLAETSRRWSPYTYCYNNPVIFIDPDGMEAGGFGQQDMFGRDRFDENGMYVAPMDRGEGDGDPNRPTGFQNAKTAAIDMLAVASLRETAKLYFDDEDVSKLNEQEKQKIFKTDETKTVGILLWEFATGTGKKERAFNYGEHPFATNFIDRKIDEIIRIFNAKLNKAGYTEKPKNTDKYRIPLLFSPTANPSTWGTSIAKHLTANNVDFFIGGAPVYVTSVMGFL